MRGERKNSKDYLSFQCLLWLPSLMALLAGADGAAVGDDVGAQSLGAGKATQDQDLYHIISCYGIVKY